MDKQNMVHLYNDILSNKKEWATDTLNSYAKWKMGGSKSDLYYDSTYMTFGKRWNYRGRNQIQGENQRWGKRQVFPRSSLGIVLPAPILLYSCLCFQLWIQDLLKLEFLIQKYKHEVSLVLIMEVASQQASHLAVYFCSWVGSVFCRLSVPLHLPITLLSRESKPGCWLGRQLSRWPFRTECCTGSLRIIAVGNVRTIGWDVGRRGSQHSL